MQEYMIITKNRNGSVTIRDTVTDLEITYYFHRERDAIRKHRQQFNLQRKRFTKIYL
jgi:hypothetical protein